MAVVGNSRGRDEQEKLRTLLYILGAVLHITCTQQNSFSATRNLPGKTLSVSNPAYIKRYRTCWPSKLYLNIKNAPCRVHPATSPYCSCSLPAGTAEQTDTEGDQLFGAGGGALKGEMEVEPVPNSFFF